MIAATTVPSDTNHCGAAAFETEDRPQRVHNAKMTAALRCLHFLPPASEASDQERNNGASELRWGQRGELTETFGNEELIQENEIKDYR